VVRADCIDQKAQHFCVIHHGVEVEPAEHPVYRTGELGARLRPMGVTVAPPADEGRSHAAAMSEDKLQ
jgi:hypothetical protein